MQLLESYLYEVGNYLPEDQREDILVELRSSLEEEVRDSAGTDKPTRNQIETVLNRFGHPINVASAYKEPRYLIGPELYPAFVDTLSTILIVSFIAIFSLQLLTWVTQGWASGFWGFTEDVLRLSVWLVAITVISFATLEHYSERLGWYDNWKASSLRLTPPAPINRSDIVTNIVSEGVFLLWWNSALVFRNSIPTVGDEAIVSLSSVWEPLFWPINILVSAWLLIHILTLLRRRWTRLSLSVEILLGTLAIVLCVYLIQQPTLITVAGELEGKILLDRSVKVSIGVLAIIIAWDWWQSIKRWK